MNSNKPENPDRSLLIVTPARNESLNILKLAESLSSQTVTNIALWVIVNDGSTDKTLSISENVEVPFPKLVINRFREGSLITGAAFAAWWEGVDKGLEIKPNVKFIMKLDADVLLKRDYFEILFSDLDEMELGVFGGVINGIQKEQKTYVPGPVKIYSRAGLSKIRELPIATGFDVMDELLCRSAGLNIIVDQNAKFSMNRQIGHSQGQLHGRYRNGVVSRWVGYSKVYFALHALRYFFRKPYIFGSIWMIVGFIRGGDGPYPPHLKKLHKSIQIKKIQSLIKSPIKTIRDLYF